VTKLNEQIRRLTISVTELKSTIETLEREKQHEIAQAAKAKLDYQMRIKDLEE